MSDDQSNEPLRLAKLSWVDPDTGSTHEHVLVEGATLTIGRSTNNDICIPDRHVSRRHAVVKYRDGIFMIDDLDSANGTFVNDMRLTEEFPLASGDQIRLYVPVLVFSSVVSDEEAREAREHGTLIGPSIGSDNGRLIITNGPQEDHVIPLLLEEVTIGRATSKAAWEVGLQDPAVSRPHACIRRTDDTWSIFDMNSSNGTFVNDVQIGDDGYPLKDGDIITCGATLILFRTG